jgi:predicted transglutaminase-like cysteine proteinase
MSFADNLQAVNYKVNSECTYQPDTEHYGKSDFWSLVVDGKGDCEDYALTKRKLLLDQGIPHEKIRIALCWVETGEYHCVLVVTDDEADCDWVLDNRYPDLMKPGALVDIGYVFHMIQIAGTSKFDYIDAITPK